MAKKEKAEAKRARRTRRKEGLSSDTPADEQAEQGDPDEDSEGPSSEES